MLPIMGYLDLDGNLEDKPQGLGFSGTTWARILGVERMAALLPDLERTLYSQSQGPIETGWPFWVPID